MSLYNAYKLYPLAIYLNNVLLTVLLEMVCITYQFLVCNACHKCTNIMHASFLEQAMSLYNAYNYYTHTIYLNIV